MGASLDRIGEITPQDVRGIRALLEKFAEFHDAFSDFKIVLTSQNNDLSFSKGNVILELNIPKAVQDAVAPSTPTPFRFVQVAAKTNRFKLYPGSYLRANPFKSDYTAVTNSTSEFAFAAGDSVWLQCDYDDNGAFHEASLVKGQTAPYESNGGYLVTFAGGDTSNDPYVQDQGFTNVLQVFAADASGQPIRGGIVYTVDGSGTRLELVQMTHTNLSLQRTLEGQSGLMALPDCGPLIS